MRLKIGVDSWIIQDGNYDDFAEGTRREFALEFYRTEAVGDPESKDVVLHHKDNEYLVCAETIYATDEVEVIDFGLRAYQESKGQKHRVGAISRFGVSLGIDPFFYFEYLHENKGIPPLIYTWEIKDIYIQTAPYVKAPAENMMVRDQAKLGWRRISKTDAWNDDDGHANYLLECERQEIAPKFR